MGFFAAVLMSQWVVVILPILAVLLQVLVYKEIIAVRYHAVKEKNLTLFRTLNWFFLLIVMFYFYAKPAVKFLWVTSWISQSAYKMFFHYHLWISFCLYVIGFCWFIISLKPKMYKYQFTQLAWTALSLLIVVFQCASFIYNFQNGIFWVVFPACMIIINDITAYFWGVAFGRKFIKANLTSLSPNKTWEGFLGALFTTVVLSIPMCYWFMQSHRFICPHWGFEIDSCVPIGVWMETEHVVPDLLVNLGLPEILVFPSIYIHAVCLAVFASLIAPFGGFFASGMKRAYNIKDFNNVFPGHGGFYDRFDCQLIMTLCTHVHFRTFVQMSPMTVPQIMTLVSLLSLGEQQQLLTQLQHHLSNTI